MTKCQVVTAFIATLTVLSPPARAHRERGCALTSIEAPDASPEMGGTSLYGINDDGLATGYYVDGAGTSHGLLWRGGRFTTVDVPGQGPYGTTWYYSSNEGVVAGGYYDNDGLSHSVLYHPRHRRFEYLPDFPGATFNSAGSVDDRGRSSGNYTLDPNVASGFVAWLYDGSYDFFVAADSDPARLGTATYGMNDHGTVAGNYLDALGVAHGFTRAIGEDPVPFDVAGASSTRVYGINDEGVLSGRYVSGGQGHGFVWLPGHHGHPGQVVDRDFPGALRTVVAGVNNEGDIAGWYVAQDFTFHGFVGRGCQEP